MAFKIPSGLGMIEDLIRRFANARTIWQLWRSLHQEAYDFAMPERETLRFRSQGQRKNRHVFDSTAIDGLEIFANRVQGGFFPDWLQWMEFRAGEDIPKEEKKKFNASLEEVTDLFFGYFHQSNFSTEITPALKDWGIGTGGIEVEEGRFNAPGEAIFECCNIPLAEIYPERPARGPVKTSWREQEIEAGNIKETWPDATIPNSLQSMLKTKPYEKVKIINGHVYNPKDGKYYQIVIEEASKALMFVQDFKTKRRIIFRANVTPGEAFGRGPIIRLLPDIRTINKVKQFILENAAIQMAGIYTGVDDGVFNPYTVKIAPGAIMPVTSNNSQNPTLRALDRAGDLGLGSLVLDDLKQDIRRALLAEPLGDITDPVRTATEQVIRQQEMLKRQNTAFGRLYSELVVPLVRACLDIAIDLGKINPIKADGKQVKIKMVSPLAKQQDLEDFQSSQVWFNMIQQLGPETMGLSVKTEELPSFWGEKLGVPSSRLIRSDTERQRAGQLLMQSMQQNLGGANDGGPEGI